MMAIISAGHRQMSSILTVCSIALPMVEKMSDEKLTKMMPYTQMVIKTNDGKALAHEDEIADAIDHRYSAMIDRKSVPGLARLDSELDQHQTFSYSFMIIFVYCNSCYCNVHEAYG
jgi:hypothetical protein